MLSAGAIFHVTSDVYEQNVKTGKITIAPNPLELEVDPLHTYTFQLTLNEIKDLTSTQGRHLYDYTPVVLLLVPEEKDANFRSMLSPNLLRLSQLEYNYDVAIVYGSPYSITIKPLRKSKKVGRQDMPPVRTRFYVKLHDLHRSVFETKRLGLMMKVYVSLSSNKDKFNMDLILPTNLMIALYKDRTQKPQPRLIEMSDLNHEDKQLAIQRLQSNDEYCYLCEERADYKDVVVVSGCVHPAHKHCMLKWIKQKQYEAECPCCRNRIFH